MGGAKRSPSATAKTPGGLRRKKLQQVPEDYAQCFTLLGKSQLIPIQLAERLAAMARFRNRLVHLYWDIDYGQVYDVIQNDLDDLEAFSHEVAEWL